ncbi:MAG: AraC family transcriptional regulator [Lamprobacter sp.]|nr:AraC family transcriptional regulator [Lamprobacter sp.]
MLTTAVRGFHRLLNHHGLAADAMFIDAGLDPQKLNDAQARYPLDRVRALWRQANEQIKDPCWGLVAGEMWRPTDYHALGYAYLASSTLESAFRRIERYFSIVIQDISVHSDITAETLRVIQNVPAYAPSFPAAHDIRLSTALRLCRDVYGNHFRPQEVQLAHPWQPCGYEDFFGCPVRFDAEQSALSIPLDVARQALPAKNRDLARSNDQILQDLERRLIDNTIVGRVHTAIIDNLPEGTPSAQQVARQLAVSARTLQRKLQEEGTSFQAELDRVRRQLAEQYIQSDAYDLQTITYLTGFANPPAFSRAYKKWTGRSPSEDRAATRP